MTLPDFSALTAVQFAEILILVALVDLATGVIGALRAGTFDRAHLLDFLDTHGVQRVLPIGGLFAIGQSAGSPALCGVADAALAAYVLLTLGSAYGRVTMALRPQEADLLVAFVDAEFTIKGAAFRLGIPVGTATKRLSRLYRRERVPGLAAAVWRWRHVIEEHSRAV